MCAIKRTLRWLPARRARRQPLRLRATSSRRLPVTSAVEVGQASAAQAGAGASDVTSQPTTATRSARGDGAGGDATELELPFDGSLNVLWGRRWVT